MECGHCGRPGEQGARFCAACGKPLGMDAAPPTAVRPRRSPIVRLGKSLVVPACIVGGLLLYMNLPSQRAERAYRHGLEWLNRPGLSEGSHERSAIEHLSEALRLRPDYAEAWYALGDAQRRLKNRQDAVEALQKAVQLNPGYEEAWLLLGHCLYELDRFREAKDAYERCTVLDPADRTAREWLDRAIQRLFSD